MRIVTLDFHNTLVSCDRWFEVEVRTLPWEVILELDTAPCDRPPRSTVLSAYQKLRAGVILSGDEIDSYDSVAQIFAAIGFAAGEVDIRTIVDRLMKEALDSATLLPGAETLVRDLHQAGTRLAVISSAIHHEFLESALDRFRITDCFEHIVTSASSGHYKSNPEIYRSTIERMDGHPPDCVHIGDSLRWDVESAQKVGMKTVWLDRNGVAKPWDDAPLPLPDVRIESLAGASGIIVNLIESVSTRRE